MIDIAADNNKIKEAGDIQTKDIDISETKHDLQENLNDNDTNLGKMIFDLKKREKDGTIYKYMGIKWFRKNIIGLAEFILPKYISKNNRRLKYYSLTGYDKKGLEQAILFGKMAEPVHILGSIAGIISMTVAMIENGDLSRVGLLVFLFNFYCMILQRYNRGKLTKVLQKKKEQNTSKIKSFMKNHF